MVSEEGEKKTVRRPWRRRVVLGLCILFVLVAPLTWFWRQAHARITVISKTDSITGYHVAYTISKGWKKGEPPDDPDLAKGLVDSQMFSPPVPSGLQAWIEKHFLHRASPINVHGDEMNSIVEFAFHGAKLPDTVEDSGGYVWLQPPPNSSTLFHIVNKERLSISGEPATWLVGDEAIPGTQQKIYVWILIVKPRHISVSFIFEGAAEGEPHYQTTQQEMLAIRKSIRLEKVPSQGLHFDKQPEKRN